MPEPETSPPAESARDSVVRLLLAAGFAQHAPKSRRKSDPAAADGFRVFGVFDTAGKLTATVLVTWVPVGGGDHKKTGQLATCREMTRKYADVARAAGWTAEFEGLIWCHARLTPQEAATAGEDGVHA